MGSGGTNDVVIILSIITFLTLLGAISPFIQNATDNTVTNYGDLNVTTSSSVTDVPDYGSKTFSGADIFGSIAIAFIWYFQWMEAIPILIALHIVIRLILGVLIYRQLRSGGG